MSFRTPLNAIIGFSKPDRGRRGGRRPGDRRRIPSTSTDLGCICSETVNDHCSISRGGRPAGPQAHRVCARRPRPPHRRDAPAPGRPEGPDRQARAGGARHRGRSLAGPTDRSPACYRVIKFAGRRRDPSRSAHSTRRARRAPDRRRHGPATSAPSTSTGSSTRSTRGRVRRPDAPRRHRPGPGADPPARRGPRWARRRPIGDRGRQRVLASTCRCVLLRGTGPGAAERVRRGQTPWRAVIEDDPASAELLRLHLDAAGYRRGDRQRH